MSFPIHNVIVGFCFLGSIAYIAMDATMDSIAKPAFLQGKRIEKAVNHSFLYELEQHLMHKMDSLIHELKQKNIVQAAERACQVTSLMDEYVRYMQEHNNA
jgi:hypothetical protein